jgi:hypothetical protein
VNPLLLIATVAIVFVALFLLGVALPPPDPMGRLEREYVTMMGLGAREGRRHLQLRLEALRERKPGQSDRWYLTWLVDDLRRAKRG